ncbi:MAG: nuclear transport factor 2 family protein [Candidatus Thermoplasmatota archaeon]
MATSRIVSTKARTVPEENGSTVRRLYEAFALRDGAAMAACYHADATFTDPVFVGLKGAEVGRMWQMLTAGAKDLEITFRDIETEGDGGRAHWEAIYTFSRTGRKVHNVLEARFTFRDGLILDHQDSFKFWRWSRMAFGILGVLLGWTPILKRKVRADARRRLAAFEPAAAKPSRSDASSKTAKPAAKKSKPAPKKGSAKRR